MHEEQDKKEMWKGEERTPFPSSIYCTIKKPFFYKV